MKLFDNQWGFSVDHSNPFLVFPLLQKVAEENVGQKETIDLSRGDPGYGFAPSIRGREFMSFLLFLDTKLNTPSRLFIDNKKSQETRILEDIATYARTAYVPAIAERYLKDLSEFIQRSIQIGKEQGLDWSAYEVLYELFKNSTVSGGTYHNPQGELLFRAIVAWWHKKAVSTPIDYNDLVFTAGASHAIGTLFKLLGQEGLQYLTTGDKVLISSPVYSPYNTIMEHRGIEVVNLSLDPLTGKIDPESLEAVKEIKNIKAILIIDPNNPTGFSMDEGTLNALAELAEQHDSLIITDEVYSAFFEDRHSVVDKCPQRTLRIQARSKIERSTGLRFGDLLITKVANDYLTNHMFKGKLQEGQDFKKAFIFAKGPGGILGEFQHTTFVPGPSQVLGAAHILLGEEERQAYRDWMVNNGNIFCKTLGLAHEGNRYYIIFDLNDVPGCTKTDVAPEEKISELAKRGVIFLPANQFFSEADRNKKDRRHMVRASLANANPDQIRKAAEITKEYLTS